MDCFIHYFVPMEAYFKLYGRCQNYTNIGCNLVSHNLIHLGFWTKDLPPTQNSKVRKDQRPENGKTSDCPAVQVDMPPALLWRLHSNMVCAFHIFVAGIVTVLLWCTGSRFLGHILLECKIFASTCFPGNQLELESWFWLSLLWGMLCFHRSSPVLSV